MDILNMIASMRNVFIYFAMCMCVPSLILYISECVVIIRHKNFRNSFYWLFLIRAIPDLLYVLDSYYGYRLPMVAGEFLLPAYQALPNWALALFYFFTVYTLMADNLATCLILVNRLSAIALPLRHEQIWNKLLLPGALLVFLLPIYFSYESFGLHLGLRVSMHDPRSGNATSFDIAPTDQNDGYFNSITYTTSITSIIFLVVCLVLNIATLVIYRQNRKKHMAANSQEGIEKKLLVYAILTFVGHMLISLLMIGLYLSFSANQMALADVINSQYPWVVDLGTIVMPSWLLLWASPTFRQQWAADYLPKCVKLWRAKNQSTVNAIVVSNVPKSAVVARTVLQRRTTLGPASQMMRLALEEQRPITRVDVRIGNSTVPCSRRRSDNLA